MRNVLKPWQLFGDYFTGVQKMKILGLVGVSLLLVTSCVQKPQNDGLNPLLKMSKNIISTRPQNSKQFFAILKLQSPALLESGSKQGGRLVVDQELLKKISEEQDEAIAALKALSPEVQVIYKYKMVLNGLAVVAPSSLEDKIKGIGLVAYSERSGTFKREETMELSNSDSSPSFLERNSSKFIGAEKLNLAGITGKGVKVGIIDTGIDFTHAMLGGVGTEEAYKAVDPAAETSAFPNAKVTGGIDLVGTTYDAASPEFVNHIPKPDMNPLDEGGHGTHVAGTVAGIGDSVHTYNGMAPEADLHAIKVFGADGSTSDFVVIAALEYAADPNVDGDNSDQLNVVNLSLGSGYGNPHILYSEAIKNLVNGGTVTVASAGNSGHKNYIVGAPGTSDDAISVAASVDNGDHLWKFGASRLNLPEGPLLVEAIEAATTKKIADVGALSGKLVFAGLANVDFDADLAAKIKGNVALIDRGLVNFNDKVKRAAEAGAIGVVVANNKDGAPISMGTSDKFDIPAIMITLNDGKKVKEALKTGDVVIDFKTDEKIEKPELIDTLTDFTSKGPRSIDGAIKPEIAAPGENVISAAMGGGKEAVQMSGTSMAAPHMAGVMALLKQVHPQLNAKDMKSLVMGTAKTMDVKGERYPVSLQGAGRVQADVAAAAKLISDVPAISLGELGVESKKTIRKNISLKNISSEKLDVTASFEGSDFVSMPSVSVSVDAGGSASVALNLTLDASKMNDERIREMDGWVMIKKDGQEIHRIPVLAIAHKLSNLEAKDLKVSSSSLDSAGAAATVTLENKGKNAGEVLLFNSLGGDERKPHAPSFMTGDCDLQTAGYRIKPGKEGEAPVLQVAVKLFKPMTTWNACDISLLIDADGDGVAEQELLGASQKSIPGQDGEGFVTTLLDATAVRGLRKAYEAKVEEAKNDPAKLAALKTAEDYSDAIIDQRLMTVFNNSSVAVLEIDASKLAMTREGAISFRLLVTHNEQSTVEFDDVLSTTDSADRKISLRLQDQSFLDLPETLTLGAGESSEVNLVKGEGQDNLLILMPSNRFSQSSLHEDSQSASLTPSYQGQ
jgi:subtilisin family serine protease